MRSLFDVLATTSGRSPYPITVAPSTTFDHTTLTKKINTDLLLSVTNINLLVNFSNNVSWIAFMYGILFRRWKYHHIHTIRYMLRQSVPVILFLYSGYVPWHAFNNILIAS